MAEQSVDDGGKKARSPGRVRRKPLKPLRGECRAFSGVTAVTNARVYYTPRAAAGASGARHSLRPLIERAGSKWQSSSLSGRDIAQACLRTRGCLKIESEAFIERQTRPALACHRPPPGRRIARPVGPQRQQAGERVPPHGATPADQLSSALQTQNLDLNRSRFQSKHSPEVQSMD